MLNPTWQAKRLQGFSQPRVWSIMNALAEETKSINLGQGFPLWDPPEFYMKNLKEAENYSTHQYVKVFGSKNYLSAISNFHKQTFRTQSLQNKVIAVNGGSEALYCCMMGLVNEGEEVIIFDPAYDVYRPQVQMAGGKTIGIQLKPKKRHTKASLIKRFEENPVQATEQDEWEFDWTEFEAAFNERTKILIITTPHNPVGKVFTQKQLLRIADILQKHPQVVIIEDNVYEGMTYDDMLGKPLPKIIHEKEMLDRTLSVYSGGKLFQATGVRCGWVIGPQYLLKSVGAVFQVTCFSQYNIVQNAIAKSLQEISRPENTYLVDYAKDMVNKRNLLVKILLNSSFDIDLWVPKGSHFIIVDISRVQVKEKFYLDDKGLRRTKDYAFAYQLAKENGVICIPCSPFYDKNASKEGQNYVRFAFCKGQDLLLQAGTRLK